MVKFKEGQTLTTRSICDHTCIFKAEVLKRTEKTVLVMTNEGKKRCKIHRHEGEELIYPFGRYSMCPIFRASK